MDIFNSGVLIYDVIKLNSNSLKTKINWHAICKLLQMNYTNSIRKNGKMKNKVIMSNTQAVILSFTCGLRPAISA